MVGRDHLSGESHLLRGAIDRKALITIRDLYTEEEPLATADLDNYLSPQLLTIELADGLCDADSARIDVQWTTQGDYKFHYTDDLDLNFRWGRHPTGNDFPRVDGLAYFHPPPDASSDPNDVENSCIEQVDVRLVTRAVIKLWRVTYHRNELAFLNAGDNPP
jgi:hypothetical protein